MSHPAIGPFSSSPRYFHWDSNTSRATFDEMKTTKKWFSMIPVAGAGIIIAIAGLTLFICLIALAAGGSTTLLVGVFIPIFFILVGIAGICVALYIMVQYIIVVDFENERIEVTLQHPICACLRRAQKGFPVDFSDLSLVNLRIREKEDEDENVTKTGYVDAQLTNGKTVLLFRGKVKMARRLAEFFELLGPGGEKSVGIFVPFEAGSAGGAPVGLVMTGTVPQTPQDWQ